MSIRFVCPFGHPLVVPDERAGKRGRCPVCRQRLIVPTPDDDSPTLERLPWKRAWPDEPISVDGAGGGTGDGSSNGSNSPSQESAVGSSAGSAVTAPADSIDAPTVHAQTNVFARFESEQFQYPHDGQRAWRARLLAVALLALAIFSAAPASAYLDGASTAAWCWIVLAGSGVVGASALAVLWLPDWSTLWITALLTGLSTAGYFVALCAAIVAPTDLPLPIGLEAVRASVAGWSGLLVLLTAAFCHASTRLSGSWRGDYDAARRDWHLQRGDAPTLSEPVGTSHAPAADQIHPSRDQAATPPLGPLS